MPYRIVEPPFADKPFEKMSKQELEVYRTWFHQTLPARVSELAKAVRATEGFKRWRPDESPASLGPLGDWFRRQVRTRRLSDEERAAERAMLSPFDDSDDELAGRDLTEKTFSLAVDVGMYFGSVVKKNVPGTRWEQVLKDKRFEDYGQPVIKGSGKVRLNPVDIAVTLAYGFARKSRSGSRLRDLYEVWLEDLG